MRLKHKITIAYHFFDLEYPRIERTKHHQLINIIALSLCAMICGADTWVDIESYGRSSIRMVKENFRIAEWHTFT